MTITLYNTSDDRRKVTKTLTQVSEDTATATNPCDVLNPKFVLSGSALVNAINSNYCYCSTFGRYYFITGYTIESAARIVIECAVDPLMSWGGQIRSSRQLVTRSESIGKPTYIPDSYYPLKPCKEMAVIKFEGGDFNLGTADASSLNFVINVSGGA